jgi:hypothetical protein
MESSPILAFQLELPRIVLGRQPRRSFTFTGVPSEEMSLMLYVEGSSLDDFDALKTVQMEITARLFEEATTPQTSRRALCEAKGSPSGKYPEFQWVVTASAYHAAFWHCQCLRMPLSKLRRYTLDLEITPTGPALPTKTLVPTLEGGGIQLS